MATAKGKIIPKGKKLPTRTIRGKSGQKPIKFKAGGLHQTTGTPAGQKIPASKLAAAAAGKYGSKGKKQAALAKGLKKMRG